MARGIVAQLANLFGPGELKVVLLADLSKTEDVDEWSWATILPHTQQPDSSAQLAHVQSHVGGAAQAIRLGAHVDDGYRRLR